MIKLSKLTTNKKLLKLLMFFLLVLSLSFFLVLNPNLKQLINKTFSAGSESDAIAIKILENPNNFHPKHWYYDQGYRGNIQELEVDGYKAIRSGRTTYVNVGNIDSAGNFDTFIYLISYTQDASAATQEIHKRMLKNWKFNSNLNDAGTCSISALICLSDEECSSGYTCQDSGDQENKCFPEEAINCRVDKDCPDKLFCNSDKAKITRDTIRLGDLAEIAVLLYQYQDEVGYYPALGAGTYLPRRTMSVWPSWANEFAQVLKTQPPKDPINVLGACGDPCPGDYTFNPETCWDENEKWFASQGCSYPIRLPANSYAYFYTSEEDLESFELCAETEFLSTSEQCIGPLSP